MGNFQGYPSLLRQIKHRVSFAQQKAMYAANEELLRMNWDIGEMLTKSQEADNKTIGLLLCKTKDRIKAEYALRDIQKPIGVSDYELGQALPKDFRSSLPSIEEIEKGLNEWNQE